jgi:spermidine/putrescine transport system permease protein
MKNNTLIRRTSILSFTLWLAIFAVIPFALVLLISFQSYSTNEPIIWQWTFNNYHQLMSSVFFMIFVRSIELASFCTLLCLLLAYPFAFLLSQIPAKNRSLLLVLLIIPFWTSSLIRTYAILTLIKAKGLINHSLLFLGIIHHPMQILYSNTAVIIGIVYNLLPYMILPLYSNIEKLDHNIFNAARDLGASRLRILWRIAIPLTLPGIVAGVTLVLLPAMTLFYIPDILGGAKSLLLGNLVEQQFLSMNNWPGGAATSVVLTLLMLVLMYFYRRTHKNSSAEGLL